MMIDFTHTLHSYSLAWASYQIRIIPGCACAANAGNDFPRGRLQKKPLASDPDMHHGTCMTHVPWRMSGSLTRCGGENVPGIPGACASATLRIWPIEVDLRFSSMPVERPWSSQVQFIDACIKIESPAKFIFEWISYIHGWVDLFSICALLWSSTEALVNMVMI